MKIAIRYRFIFERAILCSSLFIFAKTYQMDQVQTVKKSRALYWVLFFISIVVFVFVYKIGGGYVSMILPFNCTFFAQAMDLM